MKTHEVCSSRSKATGLRLLPKAQGGQRIRRIGPAVAWVWLGACIGTASGSTAPDALRARLHPPIVAAHRGGYFETGSPLAKVRATLKTSSADVLEIDLRRTRDGVVVVSHDASAFKSGECEEDVETLTYAALAACAAAAHVDTVPRFEAVLDEVRGRAVVNAEFKTESVIVPAIRIVETANAKSWVYFQATGDLTKYRIARQLDPEVALLLKVTSDAEIERAIALHDPHLPVLELDRDFVTPQRVARIHAGGMLASVNSFRYQFTAERFSASCERVFEMGVDIAVSNNAASCSMQRGAWSANGRVTDGSPLDRRHLRGYFGGSKLALELFFAGLALLVAALAVRFARRYKPPV